MTQQPSYTVNTKANFTLGGGDLFGTAAMIALADFGQVDLVKDFGSITELKEYYKSGVLVNAAEKFFNGGGNLLTTVRVAGTAKAKATLDLTGITIDAKFEGTYGNTISVSVTENGANRDVIIYVGTTTEKYLDIASNQLIVDAINAGSSIIDATKDTDTLIAAATQTNLAGGLNGTTVTATDYGTIIENSLNTKDWDYLLTPEETLDAFHATMAGYIVDRETNENKYSTYVCGVDKFEAIATTIARTATDALGNIACCHTAFFNGTTDDEKLLTANWLDATYTAALYTGKLCALAVNLSPTYKELAMTGGKSLAENDYTSAERNQLINAGFTVVGKTFTNIYGVIDGVTRVSDNSTWQYKLDYKRKVDFIKQNVFDISKGYIGQINDDITRRALKSSVNAFMLDITKDRIIESSEVEVLKGVQSTAIDINVSVLLISEVHDITFNLTLNV